MKKIFLCCGAGMSSGFLAQSLRKAAKKRKIPLEVTAASESVLDNYLQQTDLVLLAPHMSYLAPDVQNKIKGNIAMQIIPKDIYGTLDGSALLIFVLDQLKESNI